MKKYPLSKCCSQMTTYENDTCIVSWKKAAEERDFLGSRRSRVYTFFISL